MLSRPTLALVPTAQLFACLSATWCAQWAALKVEDNVEIPDWQLQSAASDPMP